MWKHNRCSTEWAIQYRRCQYLFKIYGFTVDCSHIRGTTLWDYIHHSYEWKPKFYQFITKGLHFLCMYCIITISFCFPCYSKQQNERLLHSKYIIVPLETSLHMQICSTYYLLGSEKKYLFFSRFKTTVISFGNLELFYFNFFHLFCIWTGILGRIYAWAVLLCNWTGKKRLFHFSLCRC